MAFFKVQFFPRSYASDLISESPFSDPFSYTHMTSSLATRVGMHQRLSIINNALKYVSKWSGQSGQDLNTNTCVQCTFSVQRKRWYWPWLISYHKWQRTIHGWHSCLPWGYKNAKWTNVERIIWKCVRLPFYHKETSKVINACWIYSQICRGVWNALNTLLFNSHFPWAS